MNLLLTEEEMYSLMETFKQCKIIPGVSLSPILTTSSGLNMSLYSKLRKLIKGLLIYHVNTVIRSDLFALIDDAVTLLSPSFCSESCLVSDELLQYRHFVTKQLFERDLTDEEEEEVLAQFAALDPDKKGQIEWSDFLFHESLSVLQKFRTEVMWDMDKFSLFVFLKKVQ